MTVPMVFSIYQNYIDVGIRISYFEIKNLILWICLKNYLQKNKSHYFYFTPYDLYPINKRGSYKYI